MENGPAGFPPSDQRDTGGSGRPSLEPVVYKNKDTGEMEMMPLVIAVCCREWPVVPFYPMGPCGDCGRVPVRR